MGVMGSSPVASGSARVEPGTRVDTLVLTLTDLAGLRFGDSGGRHLEGDGQTRSMARFISAKELTSNDPVEIGDESCS